ncbi:hypothetical protein [Nocardia sp. NPDC052566]|uniref:LppU/SCO3897 family protein n=1 Tax=Nocardia sp. NPDC052566 TaxID=3364330 RepID=UPI0037C64009
MNHSHSTVQTRLFRGLACLAGVAATLALTTACSPGAAKAKVGDCLTGKSYGKLSEAKIVPCSDKDATFRVSAVLGAGKSKDCPSDGGKYFSFTDYYEVDGKTFCLKKNK